METVQRGEALFVINHGATAVTVAEDGTDLLTGGDALGMTLEPQGVAIIAPRVTLDTSAVGGNSVGAGEPEPVSR